MAKRYLIDELPEEYRRNLFDAGVPAGVYLDPNTNQMVIQIAEGGAPATWALGAMELEESLDPKLVKLGDREIDTRPLPPSGYPIEHITKIIEAVLPAAKT